MGDCTTSPAKPCCAPRPERPGEQGATAPEPQQSSSTPPSSRIFEGLVPLPGGVFRMGTDYAEAFPADGEGPVRPGELSA